MAIPALDVQSVSKTFRSGLFRQAVRAVHRLDLRIEQGTVVAFVGPNGAGKTTSIYLMLGLLAPDSGFIRICGFPPTDRAVRQRIGFQSEIFYTYAFLTARQALELYGRLSGLSLQALKDSIPRQLSRLGLEAAMDRKVRTFSKGMVQRVGLAQALIHEPDVLILDEPTTGLDPEGRKLVADIILQEKARGATVFLSSHILSDVERTCDRVVMIRQGEVVFSEDMAAIHRQSDEWEVEVRGWTAAHAGSLSGVDCRTVSETDGRAVFHCLSAHQRTLLRRLADLPVEIESVRRRSKSLEDLYLQYLGGTSSG